MSPQGQIASCQVQFILAATFEGICFSNGWMGGWSDGSEEDEGEFRWQMGVAAEPAGQGNPRLPLHPALWGEMGGADRETGRKPLWGSIVLQMNRRLQRAFSAPLCGAKGGSNRTHTHSELNHNFNRGLYLHVCVFMLLRDVSRLRNLQVKITPVCIRFAIPAALGD